MTRPRVVIVTGGGTGIGLAASRRFCEAGDWVVIVGRRQHVLVAAAESLAHAEGRVDWICANLTKLADVKNLAAALSEKGITKIDVLVNNAGSSSPARGKDLEDIAAQYLDNFQANALSAVLVTDVLKPRLKKHGRIINMSSLAALRGGSAAYSTAKAAIIGWSYSLANELSFRDITVNVVAPGYVPDTEFFGGTITKETHDWLVSMTPLQRAGTAQDVAGTVFFLASREASFITGQVIQVNGGALFR